MPNDTNGFSFQIGLPQLAVLLILFYFIVKNIKKIDKNLLILVVSIVAFIALLFSPSAFIWENIPFLSEINYPWTILGILMFLISLASGFITKPEKVSTIVVLILAFISLILITPYAKPQSHIDRGDQFYLTNQATTTSSTELMPLWVKRVSYSKD